MAYCKRYFLAVRYGMTWREKLTKREAAELERAERRRDSARADYNAVRLRLKNRADARLRKDRADQVTGEEKE